MADSPPYPGVPRWVKLFGMLAIVVALLFVALHLKGHSPGQHMHGGRSDQSGEPAPRGDGRR